MSWTDPCSNCGEHRADCQCGDWNGYKKAEEEKKKEATKSLQEGVVDLIKAWESLPGNKYYPGVVLEKWLVEHMKPAINNLRNLIK